MLTRYELVTRNLGRWIIQWARDQDVRRPFTSIFIFQISLGRIFKTWIIESVYARLMDLRSIPVLTNVCINSPQSVPWILPEGIELNLDKAVIKPLVIVFVIGEIIFDDIPIYPPRY